MTPRLRAVAEAGALVLLAWIAIGVLDGRRGLWQDDVQILFRQFSTSAWFLPYASPARRLVGVPFEIALWTPWPVSFLYAVLGAAWLAIGLLARALARRLWPDLAGAGFLAGALAVCGTADFFTSSLVALHYVLSVVAALGALVCLVDWCVRGGGWRLALAVSGLVAGLMLTDTPLTVWFLGPLLLLVVPADRRRVAIGLSAWLLAAVPYLALVVPAALNASSYLSHAMQPLPWGTRARRLLELVAFHFTPWRWGEGRPLWFPREPVVMATASRVALAVTGALAAAIVWATGRREGRAGPRGLRAAAVVALLMVGANALVASVALAEFRCRTHLLSGVWAALLLAAGLAWCASRGRAWAAAAAVVAAAWMTLGLLGGLERQDYFAGHWRRHRAELVSLREAAPTLAPDARVVLRVPVRAGFMSTDAGYLARAWMTLLHADPSLECRVVLWADDRPTSCRREGDALVCRGERSPDCVKRDGRREDRFPIDRLVWVDYDATRRAFTLRPSLGPELDPSGAYAPARLVSAGPMPPLTRTLLDRPRGSSRP